MISSSQSKLIRALLQKKYRDQYRLYIAEGDKMVKELLIRSAERDHLIQQIFATLEWIRKNQDLLDPLDIRVTEVTQNEVAKISNLMNPQPVLALVNIPEITLQIESLRKNPVLGFEAIRDPGNLGTIIRTADWFGIDQIICSPDSVDAFNPKVVQATMGAIARVRIIYHDIQQLLLNPQMKEKVVYGTFLEGNSIYGTTMDRNALILFGNESQGLSQKYDSLINTRITIPSFSRTIGGSESLNLASSVAVVCSEMKRAWID